MYLVFVMDGEDSFRIFVIEFLSFCYNKCFGFGLILRIVLFFEWKKFFFVCLRNDLLFLDEYINDTNRCFKMEFVGGMRFCF